MHVILNILRGVIATVLSLLLSIFILASILLTSATYTITNRANVKNWINASGIYDNYATIAVTAAQEFLGGAADFGETIDQINDPNSELGELFHRIVTRDLLESTVITVVDAFYDWFEGTTDYPTFSIQLSDNRADFQQLLVVGFREKIRGLPPCDPGFQPSPDFNPFEAVCLPPGFDVAMVDQFLNQNLSDEVVEMLYEKAHFDSASLNIDPQTTAEVQRYYQLLNQLPLLLNALLLLTLVVLLILIPSSKRFLMGGIVVLLPSLVGLLIGLSLPANNHLIIEQILVENPVPMSSVTHPLIINIVEAVLHNLSDWIRIVSLIYLSVGIALIGGSWYYNHRRQIPTPNEVPHETAGKPAK